MRTFLTAVAVLLCIGCGATREGPDVKGRGFLGDYSKLQENPYDGVQLRYLSPGVDWKQYDKVLLDPIQFWRSTDEDAGLSPDEKQYLADYFYNAVYESLSKDYSMVNAPESGALRISIAFVRIGDRNVTLDTVSTYWPVGRVLAEGTGAATGKPAFVGEAAFEGRITDAKTGELLGAAVDRRVGGKSFKDFDDWQDVEAASDFWAKNLAFRLCKLRGSEDTEQCVEP